ncbi:MAG TPA: trypsin-like serine protease [Bdellovibrio sp.]|nr:trypsin-like serine protease [Bdellovibrio sp.]
MKKLLLSLLLVLTACQGSQVPSNLEVSGDTKADIVGGREVLSSEKLASIVLSLRTSVTLHGELLQNAQCTASALTPWLVLTAAHCVSTDVRESHIEVFDQDRQMTSVRVANAYVHPLYASNPKMDLAILELETTLPSWVERLSLPVIFKKLPVKEITASGYGRKTGVVSANGEGGILRATNLAVIDFSYSKTSFRVDQTHGHGFCQGDSGGPAIVRKNGTNFIVGVASTTYFKRKSRKEEDRCNNQGEYVNLQNSSIQYWIYKIVGRLKVGAHIPESLAQTFEQK